MYGKKDRRRVPPRLREDSFSLAYDFAPSDGWGMFPIRDTYNGRVTVWEVGNVDNHHSIVGMVPTATLGALIERFK